MTSRCMELMYRRLSLMASVRLSVKTRIRHETPHGGRRVMAAVDDKDEFAFDTQMWAYEKGDAIAGADPQKLDAAAGVNLDLEVLSRRTAALLVILWSPNTPRRTCVSWGDATLFSHRWTAWDTPSQWKTASCRREYGGVMRFDSGRIFTLSDRT